MDEAAGRKILKSRFELAGFPVQEGHRFESAGVSVEIDGFDPASKVGYEYITTAAGDREDLTADEIRQLVASGAFLVLENQHGIAAAVYVEPRTGDCGYIGMLSVDPTLQGQGIGTRLVRIAEAMLQAMGATAVKLRIINLREELGRWYRSLGYHEVGTAPYTHRPVKRPCHFVEMQRSLV